MRVVKYITILLFFTNICLAQQYTLVIESKLTGLPIRNVNITPNNKDTVYITNEDGIAKIEKSKNCDSLVVKKFGYLTQTITSRQKNIKLIKDTNAYSHSIKLQYFTFFGQYHSCLLNLRINQENYWFWGPIELGNGVEIESDNDYYKIFQFHDIIKTIHTQAEYCLIGIRGENQTTSIFAIFYKPEKNNIKENVIPSLDWWNHPEDYWLFKFTDDCNDLKK
jgi:hypothetical protein